MIAILLRFPRGLRRSELDGLGRRCREEVLERAVGLRNNVLDSCAKMSAVEEILVPVVFTELCRFLKEKLGMK